MAASSTINVAVLVEMSSAHGRGLIRGIAEYAQGQGNWSLHVEETGPLKSTPAWMKTWQGDGIIARIESAGIARALLAKRVPIVNVSGHRSPAGVPHVDLDNGGVCDLAVDHFQQRGFRHLAYCGHSQFQWSRWRREQFVQRAEAHGMACSVLECGDTARDRQRLRAWLQALPKPVGILACNDMRGRIVLEACAEAGLAVPQAVAVLGVDNDEILCTLCRPQLSSVVPDSGAIGYVAAQTLHELLHKQTRETMQRWVCPLDVCRRQSTDAAAVSDWHVSQALRIIHGQATRGLQVDDVVARTRVSRRFLEERFRLVVGRPIHAEIARVRLEAAQRLLSTTTLSLKEVAARSGFRRADYLSSVFREQVGVSPSEYRRRAST